MCASGSRVEHDVVVFHIDITIAGQIIAPSTEEIFGRPPDLWLQANAGDTAALDEVARILRQIEQGRDAPGEDHLRAFEAVLA